MSKLYNDYLIQHKENVKKGYEWMQDNIQGLLDPLLLGSDLRHQIEFGHDYSKYSEDEYHAYDTYFYGGNRSFEVVDEFHKAWLLHIHRNPHHWQHWVLINDNPDEGEICLEMPGNYIIEMICDWWAFSWKNGNLNDIFIWYEERKTYMKLNEKTRTTVEQILAAMKEKLEEV